MKLTYKINLLFTLIVSIIVLVMSLLIFTTSRQNVTAEFRQRLKTRAARTAYLYTFFRNDTTNLLRSLDSTAPPALVNKNIQIYNPAGNILYEYTDAGTGPLRVPADRLDMADEGPQFFRLGEKDVYLYPAESAGDSIRVVVAAENITGREYIADLKRIFLISYPFAVLATLLAGYLFSRSIIRPVKKTIHDVQLITSQNLSHRLYTGRRKDELAVLNATFNDLLDRLEESFAIQRRFISNASHELSTPLTAISSQIEVALLHERNSEEYRQVLRSVLEDALELQQLTRNLLEIAKAGTHGAISLEKLRIDEIFLRAHSEVLRQNAGFRIDISFPELPEDEKACQVFGNSHLLASAFRNIMENGCKYSPDRTVNVQLSFRNGDAELLFANKSDYLPEEELVNLFEPFYRSNNAEGKQGVGLGLTLTRRIISLHKGSISVESTPGQGTLFRVLLPTLVK